MDSDRIREIQQQTAYPESHSVKGALEQVWNECAQATKEEIERLKYWEQFVCERCHGVGEITVMSGQTPENFSQDNIPCPDCVGPIIDRAEAAETALASERKETERAKELIDGIIETVPKVQGIGGYTRLALSPMQIIERVRQVSALLAALQSRQGEE